MSIRLLHGIITTTLLVAWLSTLSQLSSIEKQFGQTVQQQEELLEDVQDLKDQLVVAMVLADSRVREEQFQERPAAAANQLAQKVNTDAGSRAAIIVAPERISVPPELSRGWVTQSWSSARPYRAENGSFYGQANMNGVPKTVHVRGYYRKDGTYVRGHYRSAPGSNP